MTDRANGQSGQNGPPRAYERSLRWRDIPLDAVLRPWVREENERNSLRKICSAVKAATAIELSPETIRKFIRGVGEPDTATRRALAEYYLLRHPRGYVAEKRPPYGTPHPLPPLSDLLPEGLDAARAELEKLAELARRSPGEVPASTERLLDWLERMLEAEYTGEDLARRPLDADGNPIPTSEGE